MAYLLVLVLIFGLLQSLLELRKDEKPQLRRRLRRTLSLLYIGGFLIGATVVVVQERESNSISGLLLRISASTVKIDSVNKKLAAVLSVEDSIVTQYERVNATLSKQIELETKQIAERAPVVEMADYDLRWVGGDTVSHSVEACIRNFGKRNALLTSGRGYVLFFGADNKPFYSLDFPGSGRGNILEPNEVERMRFCYYSHGTWDFALLRKLTAFGIVHLTVTYEDVLVHRPLVRHFYATWNPKQDNFGGPKDWQIQLAQKWEKESLR